MAQVRHAAGGPQDPDLALHTGITEVPSVDVTMITSTRADTRADTPDPSLREITGLDTTTGTEIDLLPAGGRSPTMTMTAMTAMVGDCDTVMTTIDAKTSGRAPAADPHTVKRESPRSI